MRFPLSILHLADCHMEGPAALTVNKVVFIPAVYSGDPYNAASTLSALTETASRARLLRT
jgi:hypothetical protein